MELLNFHVDSFAGSNVDKANAIIRDVALITKDVTAEGHDLEVDGQTLTQMLSCAQKRGKVPVKLDHGSGIKDLNGYLDNFRLVEKKLIGDWHLLKSDPETPKMLERAEVMPTCFGMSAAFKGEGQMQGNGKKAARCFALKSVDCVTSPAANPDGLFSEKEVDTPPESKRTTMPEDPKNPTKAAEPTLADVMALLQGIQSKQAEQAEAIAAIQAGGEQEGQELSDEQLAEIAAMGDDQLEKLGLTRDQVEAEVEARGGYADEEGEGEGEPAGSGAAAGGAEAALAALTREVLALKAKDRAIELQAQEHAFDTFISGMEEKIELASKEITELRTKTAAQEATIKRFETRSVTPSKPILFDTREGVELCEFQTRVNAHKAAGKSDAAAISLAVKENPAAHEEWLGLVAKGSK